MVQMAATGWTVASLLHFLLGLGMVSLSVSMETPESSFLPLPPPQEAPPYPEGGSEAYCQMLMEGPVPPAPHQVPWYCVCSRCKGTQGPKGDWGARGLPGSPGSPGRRGLTGTRGHPGFVGRQGIKGQKGDEGIKGAQGVLGTTGLKGDTGFKGEKGDHGLPGPLGDQGPKGDDGICPDTCEPVQGPPGPPGLPGPVGSRGLDGARGPAGPSGPKGDTGIVGVPGTPGSLGQKGEPGAEGDCNCNDGAKGDSGQKGDKGDNGDEGQMGPVGQKGSQGDKGDIGPMGMMGRPGPCMSTIQSAFSAALTASFPPPNTPVVFSQVLYNVEGHYNPANGIYIAPVNGTYVFSYHLTVHERVLKVGLFHNFVPVAITTDTSDFGTASQQVILHLAKGDMIWMLVKNEVTNGMYAGEEASNTFSGFLLHPDTCDLMLTRSGPPMPVPTGKYEWGTTGP